MCCELVLIRLREATGKIKNGVLFESPTTTDFVHLDTFTSETLIAMDRFKEFLAAKTFAVAGASIQTQKYGNKVFRALLSAGCETYPINPKESVIEGHQAYKSLIELPVVPESLSIVTPPEVTRQVVADAITAGVKHIWMQPGAEDEQAAEAARLAGIDVIDDGSCVLVLLARQ